jgi:hypothetical protein
MLVGHLLVNALQVESDCTLHDIKSNDGPFARAESNQAAIPRPARSCQLGLARLWSQRDLLPLARHSLPDVEILGRCWQGQEALVCTWRDADALVCTNVTDACRRAGALDQCAATAAIKSIL